MRSAMRYEQWDSMFDGLTPRRKEHRETWVTAHHADYLFKISESGDGTPLICLEPRNGNLPALENSVFGFELREGTTMAEATAFAAVLNKNIVYVFHSVFSDTPVA